MEHFENKTNKLDKSKRKNKKDKEKLVMVSGGFDPLHLGHLLSFQAAKALGDKLIVVIDSDSYLKKKKGKVFLPLEDRVALIKELRCVDDVIVMGNGEDLGDAIAHIRPSVFAKEGDRNSLETIPIKEIEACNKVGCEIVFNVGGGKIRSSSELLKKWVESKV